MLKNNHHIQKLKTFLSRYKTVFGLWLFISIIGFLAKYFQGRMNNYYIYKYVYYHLTEKLPLYNEYPQEYADVNHYGPIFGYIIAPFAVLPDWLGGLLWCVALSLLLFLSIRKLPIIKAQHILIYWFCAHDLLSAVFMVQFNIAITAFIILSFVLIHKEKDEWAALFIILGAFIKIYTVVGLAFFFFSRHKLKFTLSCIGGGTIVIFALPMIVSSPSYIVEQYVEWFQELTLKNRDNYFAVMQNISFLGMIRKISGNPDYSDIWIIIPAIILFCIPYLRFKQFKNIRFQQTFLASVLLFIVLFSTGTEPSSYIIGTTGVAIWYVSAPWKRNKWDIGLMIFVFLLTCMSGSDIIPRYIKHNYVVPYALKALPCTIVWLKLCYELYFKDYSLIQKQQNI